MRNLCAIIILCLKVNFNNLAASALIISCRKVSNIEREEYFRDWGEITQSNQIPKRHLLKFEILELGVFKPIP